MPKTIECPRCHGKCSTVFRGQTLEEALAQHERLTHGPLQKPKPPPEALAAVPTPTPSRRRVVRPSH